MPNKFSSTPFTTNDLNKQAKAITDFKKNPTDENWALVLEASKDIDLYRQSQINSGVMITAVLPTVDPMARDKILFKKDRNNKSVSSDKKSTKKTVSKDFDSDDNLSAPISKANKSSKYGYFLISNDSYSFNLNGKPTRFYIIKCALNYISYCASLSKEVIFNNLCFLRVNHHDNTSFILGLYHFIYYPSSQKLSLFFRDSLDKENLNSIYSNDLTFSPNELSSDNCVKIILNDYDLKLKMSNDSKEAK